METYLIIGALIGALYSPKCFKENATLFVALFDILLLSAFWPLVIFVLFFGDSES